MWRRPVRRHSFIRSFDGRMQKPDTSSEIFPEKTALTIVAAAVLIAAVPYLPGKTLEGLEPLQFVSMLSLRLDFPGTSSGKTEAAKGTGVQPQTGAQAKAPARPPEPQSPLAYLNV